MSQFLLALKLIGPFFVLVGAGHLVLGPGADLMLGATATAVLDDPVLDSQNRFYGVAFTLYGGLLLLVARDLHRYRPVFLLLIFVFFAAGCARLVSLALVGLPTPPVLMLTGLELALPPLAWACLVRAERGTQTGQEPSATGKEPSATGQEPSATAND